MGFTSRDTWALDVLFLEHSVGILVHNKLLKERVDACLLVLSSFTDTHTRTHVHTHTQGDFLPRVSVLSHLQDRKQDSTGSLERDKWHPSENISTTIRIESGSSRTRCAGTLLHFDVQDVTLGDQSLTVQNLFNLVPRSSFLKVRLTGIRIRQRGFRQNWVNLVTLA